MSRINPDSIKLEGLSSSKPEIFIIKKILKHYKEKHAIDIGLIMPEYLSDEESEEDSQDYDIIEKYHEMCKEALALEIEKINECEVRGFIFLDRIPYGNQNSDTDDSDYYYHAQPVIISKQNNRISLVIFENKQRDFFNFQKHITNDEAKLINITNYNNLQKDGEFCAIFSIYALLNSLKDKDFLAKIKNPETQDLELRKITIGQGRENIANLTQDKQESYIFKGVNYKAYYKYHKLMQTIFPDHYKENITEDDFLLLQLIEEKRGPKKDGGQRLFTKLAAEEQREEQEEQEEQQRPAKIIRLDDDRAEALSNGGREVH